MKKLTDLPALMRVLHLLPRLHAEEIWEKERAFATLGRLLGELALNERVRLIEALQQVESWIHSIVGWMRMEEELRRGVNAPPQLDKDMWG